MEEIVYRGIKFDDYATDESGTWSQICTECVVKESSNIRYVDMDFHTGQGVCGVKGCNRESDHYIDFKLIKVNF